MCPWHFSLRREGVLEIGHPVVFLFHQCRAFGNKCKLWHWQRCTQSDQWSLLDLLGPNSFPTLWMTGQVSHRERAHLKVPGWSLVWNELLTKKLPMFLSRLSEIGEGCEKIVPVSESFWSHLKFLKMIDLTASLCRCNVRMNGMRSVFSFSAVCNCDCQSICWARFDTVVPRLNERNRIVTFIEKLAHCPWFFGKNQSRYYINDEVRETVSEVWNSWRVMDATMWICRFVENTSA